MSEPPQQLREGRFRLERVLGSGGMGEVHLAEDTTLHRKVAIKSVRADLCEDVEVRKRIERECLLHAKVGPHSNIVTLYDRFE
jgi:serine/threonine-protein kinase